MQNFFGFIKGLHKKVGDFWWYSLLMFAVCRISDVINAFVGLWLVPRYVSQEELGAVLPLLQVTSAFGLPISILVLTFTKFLNKYKTEGSDGKAKSLIRAFWLLAVVSVMGGTMAALWLLPHFFERIRVNNGMLGVLILLTAVLGTVNPVFSNALQALKRFNAMTLIGLLGAPIRLCVMLVAMPYRALSGYMLGQAAPSLFSILCSVFFLRKEFGQQVKAKPFLREDWKPILRFTLCGVVSLGYGTLFPAIQMMVIRQRLSELDSAAYYMISRFAEVATYMGATMSVILFPMVAESEIRGGRSYGMMLRSVVASLAFGFVCSLLLALCGGVLFRSVAAWAPYVGFVPDMVLLAVTLTIGIATANFVTHETANGRFTFLYYAVPIACLHAFVLMAFTGCEYFRGSVSDRVVDWMQSCDVATLRNVLWLFFAATLLTAMGNLIQCGLRVAMDRRKR